VRDLNPENGLVSSRLARGESHIVFLSTTLGTGMRTESPVARIHCGGEINSAASATNQDPSA